MGYIEELRKDIGQRPMIMVGANVILIDKTGQILLHHRTDGDYWGLPGGAMELGESLEETAIREVMEEINIQCSDLELFNIYSGSDLYHKYPDGNEVYNVTATYLCTNFTGEISVEQTEGRDAKFFPLNSIPVNISGPVERIIREYLESNK